ncbi:MAG: ResA-like WAxxUGC motif-containing protein, partial [Ilumatobacter sp.]
MIIDTLDIGPAEFSVATGWEIKPEGACKGEVCVPLGSGVFDATAAAGRLGMAIVHDEPNGRWAIGPESLGDRALSTAVAPELV